MTLQPIRAGFPCFGAALAGYVEATVGDLDEKNRLCPSSPYPDTPVSWSAMQLLGMRASMAFGAQPDIKAWGDSTSLNPARVPAEREADPAVMASRQRLRDHVEPGMKGLAAFAGMA
jgi:hypothetical protein